VREIAAQTSNVAEIYYETEAIDLHPHRPFLAQRTGAGVVACVERAAHGVSRGIKQ